MNGLKGSTADMETWKIIALIGLFLAVVGAASVIPFFM